MWKQLNNRIVSCSGLIAQTWIKQIQKISNSILFSIKLISSLILFQVLAAKPEFINLPYTLLFFPAIKICSFSLQNNNYRLAYQSASNKVTWSHNE